MKGRVAGDVNGDSSGSIRRRKLLAAAGAAGLGSLTGCSGDNTDDSGESTSTRDFDCATITDGYERQDVGSRPIVFDFEYPAAFGELYFAIRSGVVLYASRSSFDATFDMQIKQMVNPEKSTGKLREGSLVSTTTFNGEEVEFFGASSESDVFRAADLPYQVEGERETFETVVTLSSLGNCGDALREAADYIVTSLEFNPETTLSG